MSRNLLFKFWDP